ncbi:MAG: peptidylprolyl isomerase [Propionibacteriaceae bacterium]|nr:peptidylprolyl isomerase [Propionibacteriaceae bacterium]
MITRLQAAVAVPFVSLALAGCAVTAPTATAPVSDGGTDAAPGTVSCTYRTGGTPAKPVDPPSGENVPATGESSVVIDFGDAQVNVELDRAAAPCTVHSFENLVAQGYYNDSECHRLSTQGMFILQCGDPTATGRGGPGYTFDDELEATTGYPAGVLAMANAGANTNGSQFFFVYADTPLDTDYTVFGRLDEASNQVIADRAFQGHDASNPDGTGRPNLPTVIKSVTSG